jgi:hypothetical protein
MKTLFVLLLSLVAMHAAASIHLTAALNGAQAVPVVVTTASGTGSFVLNDDRTELKYTISYQGLSGTLTAGGHFHLGTPGRNGSVVKNTAVSGGPASGTVSGVWKSTDATQPLTTALVESLLTGRVYVNFHTASSPAGEIRGQVTLATSLHFTVDLSGAQEVPANASTGTGTGVFVLTSDRTQMDYAVAYQGLSGVLTAGGHVHVGAPGANGGVVRAIAKAGDSASSVVQDSWKATDSSQPLTSALVDSAIAGKLYVNFHTAANPGGQIRGQIVLIGGTGFSATLEANKQVPPVTADGRGVAYVVLNSARTEARYAVTYYGLTGTLSAGGHFHTGGVAATGPVVKGIATSGGPASATLSGAWKSTDATQSLTLAKAESLLTGRMYVNFHTTANPGGEIRGQLDMTTGLGFDVVLDGSQQNPAVTTAGHGSGYALLNGERNDLHYRFTYYGLSGPLTAGGHMHVGGQGRNGGVVKGIGFAGDPAANTVEGDWATSAVTQPLTDVLKDSLIAGNIYANFHTAANPGGEIRGQLGAPAGGLTDVSSLDRTGPAEFTLGQNYPNPFNPSTRIPFTVSREERIALEVFNILGQRVAVLAGGVVQAGTYTATFDARGIASGVYVYRLTGSTGISLAHTLSVLK